MGSVRHRAYLWILARTASQRAATMIGASKLARIGQGTAVVVEDGERQGCFGQTRSARVTVLIDACGGCTESPRCTTNTHLLIPLEVAMEMEPRDHPTLRRDHRHGNKELGDAITQEHSWCWHLIRLPTV